PDPGPLARQRPSAGVRLRRSSSVVVPGSDRPRARLALNVRKWVALLRAGPRTMQPFAARPHHYAMRSSRPAQQLAGPGPCLPPPGEVVERWYTRYQLSRARETVHWPTSSICAATLSPIRRHECAKRWLVLRSGTTRTAMTRRSI